MDRKALSAAALSLQVSLNSAQCDRLQRYVDLLTKWNAKFNLVSRKDVGRLWERHVLDSLSVITVRDQNQTGRDRTVLELQQAVYRLFIARITTQTEYGLGGVGDNFSGMQASSRLVDGQKAVFCHVSLNIRPAN